MEELYHGRGILSTEIPLYLSMTAAEFAHCSIFPKHTAWMACHFSPYGTGLTNIPNHLPKGSLLIVNDRTPVHRHDPMQIRQALQNTVATLDCCGVLLDMQQKGSPETLIIIKELLNLSCPVCVSDIYGKDLDCPVFLPPVPLTLAPEEYFAPWKGREIWLDAAIDCSVLTVNEKGCFHTPCRPNGDFPFFEERLHCHYRTEQHGSSAEFYLRRTKEDLMALLRRSTDYGVTKGVGLWQELR